MQAVPTLAGSRVASTLRSLFQEEVHAAERLACAIQTCHHTLSGGNTNKMRNNCFVALERERMEEVFMQFRG
jgi:hypothetical protein